jgi:hypothetical protein
MAISGELLIVNNIVNPGSTFTGTVHRAQQNHFLFSHLSCLVDTLPSTTAVSENDVPRVFAAPKIAEKILIQ